ncbi:cardiolipin synthase [Ruminococcaceae bacterium OttesenSCG-928-I18]|nr:cardiolipin synthase [Ruminococcaceae bacterium OttesenSCG-928-I18]
MAKKLLRVIFSKRFILILLGLIQIGFFVLLAVLFATQGVLAYTVITIFSVLILMGVLSKDDLNPAYKLIWVLVFVLMPVVGALFYLMWGHRHVPKKKRRAMDEIEQNVQAVLPLNQEVLSALRQDDRILYSSAKYLTDFAMSPVYPADGIEYYPLGQDFFPPFLEALRNAKKYIYMQYYIMEEGVMLNTTIDILREKAAQGVDVRVIWDGFGCLLTLPEDFDKKLEAMGIKCAVFSPIELTIHVTDYAMLNHRDHSKVTVVDGEIGFSGGLNFADEYINVKERFGEWKDTTVMVRGEAATSLAAIFLISWDFITGQRTDFSAYIPPPQPHPMLSLGHGYVQPYWDSPLDIENISENAYLNIINHASDYVYISTPYLILDHEMITNLCLSAKSGVDVRILTPGIPDKPTVYLVTQSYYPVLLRAGVRIYEYTPGFNHAKMYVSDDKTAIVGSANMDYRSLYLHFENSVAFYGGPVISCIKEDMLSCFSRSHEVTLEETRQIPLHRRFAQIVAKFLAPMM